MFSKVEFSTFYLGVLLVIQNGGKNQQSEALGELIYFKACQHVMNTLHSFLLDFWFNKTLFSICPNQHSYLFHHHHIILLSVLFFHSFPLCSCCNQDIVEFQSLSSHIQKSNMLMLTLIILRCLQAGLKCSNFFD